MIPAIIILVFTILIVFRKNFFAKELASKPFFERHKFLYLALCLTIIPVIGFNIILPYQVLDSSEEIIELGTREYSERQKLIGFELRVREHPNNIAYKIDFIEYCHKYGNEVDKKLLSTKIRTTDKTQTELLQTYINYLIYYWKFNKKEWLKFEESTPHLNYMQGKYYINAAKYYTAIEYLEKEGHFNPDYPKTYPSLLYCYSKVKPSKIHDLMANEKALPHLPYEKKVSYFFHYGFYLKFILETFKHRFLGANFITYLSAIIVSGIWILFLTFFKIFKKINWKQMTIAFLTGSLLTLFSHFLYRYFWYYWGFGINGDAWNDIQYCIVVIGGSEEIVKFLAWLPLIFIVKKKIEPIDILIYSGIAALGFAFVENLDYLQKDINVFIRTVTTSTIHMTSAAFPAFSLILMKRLNLNPILKILMLPVGFLLAMTFHGLFDVFLISPAFYNSESLYLIPFLISIILWFYMLTVSINISPFFDPSKTFKNDLLNLLISFGILGILMFQFILTTYKSASVNEANYYLINNTIRMGFFLVLMSFLISLVKPKKNNWFAFVPSYRFKGFSEFEISEEDENKGDLIINQDYTGIKLRCYSQKETKFVGSIMPISGTCIKRVHVDKDPNWYLFETNKSIFIKGFNTHFALVKPKRKSEGLDVDKAEIYFLLIKNDVKLGLKFNKKDLTYPGKVFSRPII